MANFNNHKWKEKTQLKCRQYHKPSPYKEQINLKPYYIFYKHNSRKLSSKMESEAGGVWVKELVTKESV